MRTNHAVILAAGNGTRMGRLTEDRPKAMVTVRGRTLIDRQLYLLREAGIDNITVVVGYQQQRLREHLRGRSVRFVENPRFRETNSLYSLWLASGALRDGAVILNCDVLFAAPLLDRLLNVPAPDALLFDPSRPLDAEEMKVKAAGPFVLDLRKDMAPDEADGENLGIVKIGPEGAKRLVSILDRLVADGEHQAWAPLAFARLAQSWPLVAVSSAGLAWTEIDTPDDLRRAERQIAPLVDRWTRRSIPA